MNHYERLKVTQDAPVEVIRAAYRALAAKLHPDRHGAQHIGPSSPGHEDMAAINAAYEVLNDPASRADYDAALLTAAIHANKPRPAQQASPSGVGSGPGATVAAGKVDVDWMPPRPVSEPLAWGISRQTVWIGGLAGVVLISAAIWGGWEIAMNHQMEQALSDQYSRRPETVQTQTERLAILMGIGADGKGADDVRGTPARVLSASELAHMSDAQLIRSLPDLTGNAIELSSAPLSLASSVALHPLDGNVPLTLRADGRLDEVAALQVDGH